MTILYFFVRDMWLENKVFDFDKYIKRLFEKMTGAFYFYFGALSLFLPIFFFLHKYSLYMTNKENFIALKLNFNKYHALYSIVLSRNNERKKTSITTVAITP